MNDLMNNPDFMALMQQQLSQAPPMPAPDIPMPELPEQNWYDDLNYSGAAKGLAMMGQPQAPVQHYLHRGGGLVQGPVAQHVSGVGMNTASLLGDSKEKEYKGLLALISEMGG